VLLAAAERRAVQWMGAEGLAWEWLARTAGYPSDARVGGGEYAGTALVELYARIAEIAGARDGGRG
jgi:hypothetical protein